MCLCRKHRISRLRLCESDAITVFRFLFSVVTAVGVLGGALVSDSVITTAVAAQRAFVVFDATLYKQYTVLQRLS